MKSMVTKRSWGSNPTPGSIFYPWPRLYGQTSRLARRLNEQLLAELSVPWVGRVCDDRPDSRADLLEDRNRSAIVDVTLQELSELTTRVGLRQQLEESGRQLIIEHDEITPDVH